ncbi:MAG: hypothetical protein AVDCRST_MAG42-1745 [uncultured Chthoniobacterales bacterium]|uniref:Uncharacterized protein n=1 Tax=uncultured Chthoniobacterales bacterium TaxID=1836801 RepID=A0A6J4I4E5_9BACT|nr:MAG: hypothetical protein AVDCRST_MAG42-1745 [uncultured Chthoniobacterales bacterium]
MQTGENVLIGGIIIIIETEPKNVILRHGSPHGRSWSVGGSRNRRV